MKFPFATLISASSISLASVIGAGAIGLGCSSSSDSSTPAPKTHEAKVTLAVKEAIQVRLEEWLVAVTDLQRVAPSPKGRGWDPKADADAIKAMKDAWRRARVAYENVEGAVAVLFPELDVATDARYDDFLSGGKKDDYLFDDVGVTGMHAIERILYADSIPPAVVAFESKIPNYKKAELPATETEARDFKEKLAAKLVADVRSERDQFKPLALDLAFAFRGVADLMKEQGEKVDKAATGEEESRYAQTTMMDLRSNLTGNVTVYGAFQPWITSKAGGAPIDASITASFTKLRAMYDSVKGDAIPQPPATWSSASPSEADRKTDFGRLFTSVREEVNPKIEKSVVSQMNRAAELMGLHPIK